MATSVDRTGARQHLILCFLVWLLPNSVFKHRLLRMLGNRIDQTAYTGINIVVNCGRFTLHEQARISNANVFRNVSEVVMERKTFIGSMNQISSAIEYQKFSPWVGRLVMQDGSAMTNRHYFDCSGLVLLRPMSGVGGIRSIVQSHEIDIADDVTTVGVVEIGENAMTATGCLMLKDSILPPRSILAAGSVLTKAKNDAAECPSGLYGGVPARFIGELNDMKWWSRDSYYTAVTPFDDSRFEKATQTGLAS